MKHLLQLLALSALLVSAASCDDPITQSLRQQGARAGLGRNLAQLPAVSGFETVKVLTYDAQVENDWGTTCYYARGYIIIGSALPDSEAMNVYSKELQTTDWKVEGKQYPTSILLVHGTNEVAVISIGNPGAELEEAADYTKLREMYHGIIFVRLDYILPSHGNGC